MQQSIYMEYNPIGLHQTRQNASHSQKRSPFLLLSFIGLLTTFAVFLRITAENTNKNISNLKLNPFSFVNCTAVAASSVCESNPQIFICSKCNSSITEFKGITNSVQETITSSHSHSVQRPIGFVCDFLDDHPLCDHFEDTLPCEACECQQLKEEGKCRNPRYWAKCYQCLKEFSWIPSAKTNSFVNSFSVRQIRHLLLHQKLNLVSRHTIESGDPTLNGLFSHLF